jgi:hypothetical protein
MFNNTLRVYERSEVLRVVNGIKPHLLLFERIYGVTFPWVIYVRSSSGVAAAISAPASDVMTGFTPVLAKSSNDALVFFENDDDVATFKLMAL